MLTKDPLKDISKELTLESAKKRLGILWEFKQFAMRGNVVDLAVGVVIGAAFGKIVTALVSDFITPFMSLLTSEGANLKNRYWSLEPSKTLGKPLEEAQKLGPVVMWGDFVSSVVDFIIVAFCIFLLIKLMNRLSMASAAIPPPAEPSPTEKLLAEIRDELKNKKV